jgi:hypothetical protein
MFMQTTMSMAMIAFRTSKMSHTPRFKAEDFIFPTPPNRDISYQRKKLQSSLKPSKTFDPTDFIFPSFSNTVGNGSNKEGRSTFTPRPVAENKTFDPGDFIFPTPPTMARGKMEEVKPPPTVELKAFDPAEFVFPSPPQITVSNTHPQTADSAASLSKRFDPADFVFPTAPTVSVHGSAIEISSSAIAEARIRKRFTPEDFLFPPPPNGAVGGTQSGTETVGDSKTPPENHDVAGMEYPNIVEVQQPMSDPQLV